MAVVRGVEDDTILYDLTVQAEWRQEPDLSTRHGKDKSASATKGVSGWSLLKAVGVAVSTTGMGSVLPVDLVKLVNIQTAWKLSISSDGELLAILQDSWVEIRSSQSEFTSVISRWNLLSKDPNPQWRMLCWSCDNSMLAISDSSGQIELCDARMGMPIFSIPAPSTPSGDLSQAISSMLFKELRASSNTHTQVSNDQHWYAELLVTTYQGNLVSYLVSREGDCRQSHVFSFSEHCPNGVYSLVYDRQHTVLIVGSCAAKDPVSSNMTGDSSTAAINGLTVWRVLSDSPFYKLVTDYEMDLTQAKRSGPLVKRLRGRWYNWTNEKSDGIYKLSLSPDCQLVVAVHLSGRITVWHVPSLKIKKTWALDSQPGYNEVNNEIFSNPMRLKALKEYVNAFYVSDIGWWSNEALILVRGTGSVTVASVNTLENLLGASSEWFEPTPSVTWAKSGSFFGLECESKTVNPKRHLMNESDLVVADDNYIDSDDELEMTITTRASLYVKRGLYYVTDIEKFQPPRKRPNWSLLCEMLRSHDLPTVAFCVCVKRHILKTYRLVCLKSTTPDELYARKIDNEEYGEALQLAKTYHLDCDLVYQRQWRKSPVSVASIHDYLSKIIKRSWVLHECMERVPENFDAMNELLKYGLRGTDLEALVAIGRKEDNGRFILCESDDVYLSLDGDDSAVEAHEQQNEKKANLLKEIDFHNLSLDQQELCRVRLKLLQYSDRLHTYEAVLGGMHIAGEKYDHKFFEKFRSQSIVELAVEYARADDPDAVSCILTYHSAETAEHRLPILSNFSETCSPSLYSDLLPELRCTQLGENHVESLVTDSWRKPDWCELPECRSSVCPPCQEYGAFLFVDKPEYRKFCGSGLSCQQVSEWYQHRACEIELLSGQVDGAVELIKLGIERQVKDLDQLYDDLLTMETLVYECSVDSSFTFHQLQEMSSIEQIHLMMAKSSEEMYLKNVRNWLLPFLKKCEKYCSGSFYSLMRKYLVTIAKNDLSLCLQIFKASKANVSNRIISDEKQLMSIALDCVYALTANDQLSNGWEVLECLPQKGFGLMDEESTALHSRVDDLERHLEGAHILERNDLPHTVAFFRDSENSVEEAVKLFTKITRTAARKTPALTERQLQVILTDICKLRDDVYRCVDKTTCCEIFVQSLLCSGSMRNISLAGKMLERCTVASVSKEVSLDKDSSTEAAFWQTKVPYDQAVGLVASAAREYFDASATMDDPDMDLARSCLALITDNHASIEEEKDLIESLRLLMGFGVILLPVQVRMCSDRLTLVQKSIDARPSTFKKYQRLLNLGRMLRVGGESSKEMHGKVMRLVAQAALKCHDFTTAYEACVRLTEAGYAPVWVECKALAESVDFHDVSAKIDLLTFAVIHCLPEMIDDIIHAKLLLQMQVYYEHIHSRCGHRESPMSTDNLPLSSHSAVEKTRDVLQSTNRATRKVLSCMSNAKWWKKTLGNLHPSRQNVPEVDEQINDGFTNLSKHPFYESSTGCTKDETLYATLKPVKSEFAGLSLNECIFRASKIEDMMTYCSAFAASTSSEVLLCLADEVIAKDCALGLAYLLMLPNATDAEKCFDKLPQTDLLLQLAIYYYALQIANRLRVGPGFPIPCHLDDVYQMSTANLVAAVLSFLAQTPDLDASVKPMSERLVHYDNRLTEYRQAQALEQLDRGIDVSRFVIDEKYKMDTILGLAMSLEADVYGMAISLARTYKVSLWEVYMAHIEFLFDESCLSTEDIEKRVNEIGILPELISDDSASSSFLTRMLTRVYPLINGTDHNRLLYYYTLLSSCSHSDDAAVTPQTHVRLLKKLKTAAPDMNYKSLTDGSCNPLDILESVLNQENVATIAKLASHIPKQNGGCLHSSNIYRLWYSKVFFQNPLGKKSNEQASNWLHRYEIHSDILPKLLSDDFLHVINSVTFTPKAVAMISVDSRRQILKSAMKFARQQQNKKKGADTSVSCLSWEEVANQLQQSMGHLDRLNCPVLNDLKNSDDIKMQSYAQRFDLSRSDKDKLHELLIELLVDGVDLKIVDELQRASGVEGWTVQSLLADTLQRIITSLRNAEMLFDDEVEPVDALKTVFAQVAKHEDNGGKLAGKKDVFTTMETFYANFSLDAESRLRVMGTMEEVIKMSDEERSTLLFYRTQAFVSTIDSSIEVTNLDVSSDAARQSLFDRLLETCSESRQLISLCHLINTWPRLDSAADSAKANPWCRLSELLVKTSSEEAVNEVVKMLNKLHSEKSLSLECTRFIADCLLEHSPPYLVVTAKCLLLSPYSECHQSAIDVLVQITQVPEDVELLSLILKRHLVPKSVSTNLYQPLFEFILSSQGVGSDSVPYYLQVQTVVNQLIEAGFQAEAGSLLMHHRGTHRALRTFDAAFSIVTRLFH